jgi:multidrug resistance efflux pump
VENEAVRIRRLWASCLRRRKPLAAASVLLLLAVGAGVGLHLWYEAIYFVSTENAAVAGAIVQVSSPDSGRIFRLHTDVGSLVRKEDALAVLDVPILTSLPMGGTRSTYLDAHDRLVDVTSPIKGIVVNRKVNVGDSVNPNQTLFTVVDTRRLWVVANVEETQIARVRPGQYTEIYVDALQQTLDGSVEAIIPATTSTFSLLPVQNVAGSFTKVVQLVPVKIAVLSSDAPLIVGASVRVRIHVGSASAR